MPSTSQTGQPGEPDTPPPGRRYARWLELHHRRVLVGALVVAGLSLWLATRLQVRADFANLLPPDRRSVRDIEVVKQRVAAFGSLLVVIAGDDATLRERATRTLYRRLQRDIPPGLIANLAYDDQSARQFFWQYRFTLAGLDDLRAARDALRERIRRARLAANPLFVDLTEPDDEAPADPLADADPAARLDELRARLDAAEAAARAPPGFVSRDRRYQLLIIRATFTGSEVGTGRRLLAAVQRAVTEVEREFAGAVRIGITGDILTGVHEHRSILYGMVLAAAVTVFIVACALLLYFRSLLAVLSLLWALCVGCIASFGVTELVIGHLNLASAFLAAIVIGNGINPGIILMSRYFEQLRRGRSGVVALGDAVRGAARGTLGASLTAAVAYGSLTVAEFRGFRHFGVIGAVGMVLCWIAAFTVLPAALVWLRERITARPEPAIGRILARLMPRRLLGFAVLGVLLTGLSGVITWRYVAGDPLEDDWRNLRSSSAASAESDYWGDLIKAEFDDDFNRNLSGRFVIAVASAEQVPALVTRLRAAGAGPGDDDLLYYAHSLADLVPPDQPARLALLGEIRRLIDTIDADADADLRGLRPPDDIRPVTVADVPDTLAWLFTETDGALGRIIHAASGLQYNTWNVRHLVEFARRVRALELPADAVVGGQAFVFADMLQSMEQDGVTTTLVAVLGSMLAVWLVVGVRRHGQVTLVCAGAGTLGMIALCSAFGIKVNFLDFIALPITVGIGIDYAVNIAVRERQDGDRGAEYIIATTGGAVFLCSLTTTVGYGSLLLSANAGIQSFGLAALLGELSCLLAALLLAPTLLLAWRRFKKS